MDDVTDDIEEKSAAFFGLIKILAFGLLAVILGIGAIVFLVL